ncbi:unnamed protein product, partial [Musa textilis]
SPTRHYCTLTSARPHGRRGTARVDSVLGRPLRRRRGRGVEHRGRARRRERRLLFLLVVVLVDGVQGPRRPQAHGAPPGQVPLLLRLLGRGLRRVRVRPRGGAGRLHAGTVLEEQDVVQELPWGRAMAGDSDSVAELRLAASPPSTTAMEEVEELGGQPEKRDREDDDESEAELCESAH